MKRITGMLLLAAFLTSCHKEKEEKATPSNQPPIANAGADIAVVISSCYAGRSVELDGSRSFDPEHSQLNYFWTQISGPSCVLSDNASPRAHVSNLFAGHYAFQLKVIDEGGPAIKGLSSTDTVFVEATGAPKPIEANLNVSFICSYAFVDDYEECDYFPFGGCAYYDLTTVTGNFNFPTIGQISFNAYEQADTAAFGIGHNTQMGMTCIGCAPSLFFGGTCSINFKKLVEQGGGAFNGTFLIENGSAKNNCDVNAFDNLAPLTVTGILDTTAHSISVLIKGKAYF